MSQNAESPPPQSVTDAARSIDEDDGALSAAPEDASVTLSVVTDGPRICFCAYNDDSREIWIEECMANGYEVATVVGRVTTTLQPTLILVSRKIMANEKLLTLLTTITDLEDYDSNTARDSQSRSIPYQILKSSMFDIRVCKALILQRLIVESITRHQPQGHAWHNPNRQFSRQDPHDKTFAVSRYHALASIVDLESTVELQALGSLLSYLNQTFFSTSEGGYIVVRDIIRGNLSLYMNVPPATLSALHIFATERHPLLAAKGTGNSKEGFSLFSLLDDTKSRMGRQRLREWMLKPLVDVSAIAQRQDGVELFLLPDFQDVMGVILKLLERIGSVDKIIRRMEKCVTQPQDFGILVRSINAGLQICEIIQQDILWRLQNTPAQDDVVHFIAFVQDLLQSCSPVALRELSERLEAAVDESATNMWDSKSIVIRDGYCEHLDMLRDQYHQLGDILQDMCSDLAIKHPRLSKFMDMVFFPQVRIGNIFHVCRGISLTLGFLGWIPCSTSR